jgi:hypothetical protein
MKRIYSAVMSLLMLVSVFSLSACSSSGDDENGNSNYPSPINKRLYKVTKSTSEGLKMTEYIYDSQGRITQLIEYFSNENQGHVVNSYVYDNNSITKTYLYSKDISWQNIYTLESGRVVKAYDSDTKVTTMFNYDNGYLTKETESKGREYNYIWSDGNLMEVYNGNRKFITYEYTDITAPQGFFPMGHNVDLYWGMSSYLGKTSKFLPSKYTEGQGGLIEFEWTVKDGLPIKMIENIKEAPDKGIRIFTFEWK